MQGWSRQSVGEDSVLYLLAVLVVGSLLFFPVSPGTVLADIPQIIVPLVIAATFTCLVSWIYLRGYDERQLVPAPSASGSHSNYLGDSQSLASSTKFLP